MALNDPHRAQKVLGHMNLRTTEIPLHDLVVDREAAAVFEGITNRITNGDDSPKRKGLLFPVALEIWRRGRDSNSRYAINVHTISNRAP